MEACHPESMRAEKAKAQSNKKPKSQTAKKAKAKAKQKAKTQAEKSALQSQYDLLAQSQEYILSTVVAVLLSYSAVDIQKQQIGEVLCNESSTTVPKDVFPMQFTSAALVLNATTYFLGVSQEALEQPQTDPLLQESMQINYISNLLVMLAAALRIYNLLMLQSAPKPETAAQAADLEEAEVGTAEEAFLF